MMGDNVQLNPNLLLGDEIALSLCVCVCVCVCGWIAAEAGKPFGAFRSE